MQRQPAPDNETNTRYRSLSEGLTNRRPAGQSALRIIRHLGALLLDRAELLEQRQVVFQMPVLDYLPALYAVQVKCLEVDQLAVYAALCIRCTCARNLKNQRGHRRRRPAAAGDGDNAPPHHRLLDRNTFELVFMQQLFRNQTGQDALPIGQ
jgi:hypothetical protein